MKYLIRILWLIGFLIVSTLYVVTVFITVALYPINCVVYFVITGEFPEVYIDSIGKMLDACMEEYCELKEYGN